MARGYRFNTAGVTENFDAGTLPAGWTVVDNLNNGQVWRFDNPRNRANLTGGTGKFAIMDSDFYGSAGHQDTSLVTPTIDMSSLTAPVVGFKQDYNNLGDFADVDVSMDGGTTWTTVLHQTTSQRGPRENVIQLPTAAGKSAVKVRFHNYEADFDWWWEVDDVFVGNRTCDPIPGGLVVGTVRNAVTKDGVVGATVTSLDKPDEKATTVATPDDTKLIDGFYSLFSTHRRFAPLRGQGLAARLADQADHGRRRRRDGAQLPAGGRPPHGVSDHPDRHPAARRGRAQPHGDAHQRRHPAGERRALRARRRVRHAGRRRVEDQHLQVGRRPRRTAPGDQGADLAVRHRPAGQVRQRRLAGVPSGRLRGPTSPTTRQR